MEGNESVYSAYSTIIVGFVSTDRQQISWIKKCFWRWPLCLLLVTLTRVTTPTPKSPVPAFTHSQLVTLPNPQSNEGEDWSVNVPMVTVNLQVMYVVYVTSPIVTWINSVHRHNHGGVLICFLMIRIFPNMFLHYAKNKIMPPFWFITNDCIHMHQSMYVRPVRCYLSLLQGFLNYRTCPMIGHKPTSGGSTYNKVCFVFESQDHSRMRINGFMDLESLKGNSKQYKVFCGSRGSCMYSAKLPPVMSLFLELWVT